MYRCILADDESRVRTALRRLGEWQALEIEIAAEAEDGDELLRLSREQPPDLVIIDMKMPGLCGAQLIRTMGSEFPQTQIIVCSGFDDFEYTRAAITTNVVDYLLKPVDEDDLNLALRRAVSAMKKIRRENGERLLLPFPDGEREIDLKKLFYRNITVHNIVRYLMEHTAEKITLASLAEQFFWSEEYISKKFREETGCGVFDLLASLRVERSREMLANNEKLSAIVAATGFTDESHFSKTFKKYTGMSPSEYRKKLRG